jgi:two-component system, cell cycle sensor histidine kinase and response regulator CckA
MSAAAEFPWIPQDSKTELHEVRKPENRNHQNQNDETRTDETRAEENRDAGQHLLHAQRLEAVGRLTGGVVHDFNNLLTGILLYCDLLMTDLKPGDRAHKYAEEIRGAGLQASGLVKQLLSIVRPAQSGCGLISLNDVSEGMRNLLFRLIGENIELEFHLDSNLGLVKMDHTQAQQVLLNLILNARDAMPAGGRITVAASNCKVQVLAENHSGAVPTALPCALLVVEDNGSGMDAATRDHLFEAFFTTKSEKGTGLGLATVHEIVTRSGGLIYVDSTPGRGTRMSVLLPIIDASRPAVAASSRNVSAEVPASVSPVLPGSDPTRPERKEGALQNEEESIL